MATFVILSRIAPEAVRDPKDFKPLAKTVAAKIKQQCPGVTWRDSFATLGRFDVVDIVEAAKPEEVEKAAMIIRSYGHASTETLVATPWKEFLSSL
ncbi:MAG: GYD domain-containing protein [Chthoniobacterales bacterium]